MSEVVKGRFTIDLDRARDKLGKYQLADPYAYVLEFVQAVVLRGSQNIEITVDSDDLKILFDGTPFAREELQNIELAVLETTSTPSQRSRQRLAMGLLAAQSLNPALIVIEGVLGVRWEKRKAKPATVSELPRVASNLLHVKMPWRFGVVLDLFRQRKELREEEILLLKSCGQTSVNITLNGDKLRDLAPQRSLAEEIARVEVVAPHIRGSGGLVPGSPAELTLIVNGVTVETLPLELGAIPFLATAESSQLSTDISGASVQRDEAFAEVMKAVVEARGRSITILAGGDSKRYTQEIKEELFSLPKFDTKGNLEQYPGCLMKCPIWSLADGRESSLVELQEIVDAVGYLPFSVECHLEERLDDIPGVIHCDVALRDSIRELTGWSTKNVTRRLRQQMEARENERAWRARPTNPTLVKGRYLKRASLEPYGVRGEVGIKSQTEPPLLRLILDGCLLCELSPVEWPAGMEACVEADFQAIKTHDGIVHDRVSVNAIIATAQVMRDLYEELAEEGPEWQALLADFLRVASRAQPVRYLLEACGAPSDLYADLIADREWPLLATEAESPLLEVAWVKTDGTKRLSVRELQAAQQAPTLVISETQQNTIERLLGKDFLEPETESEKRVSFRLDPTALREEKFLAALRTELSRVTQDLELRLGGFNLSRLVLVEGDGSRAISLQDSGAVQLHRDYPLIKEALGADVQDPRLLLLLVSVLFTTINRASTLVTDAQERELQTQLAEYLVTAPARLATQVEGEPTGVIEPLCHSGVCSGWAQDPAGLGLRLYFQAPGPNVTPDAVLPLDSPREDGGHHFLFDLPKSVRSGEKLVIHACLVHPRKGELVELNGSPRAYAEPHELPAKPRGEVTEVSSEGIVRGWCLDPNTPDQSPQVEFYLDGNWKEGEWIGHCKAKIADSELEEKTGFRGAHGFEFTIPALYRDGCRHTLHVYGFDTDNTAGNPLLQGCPKEFVLAAQKSKGDEAWLRGRRAMEQKDFRGAILALKLRLKLGGDRVPDDEVWSWLGAAYSASQQLGNANKAYSKAIKLAPNQAEHWYFSGLVKAQLGHTLKCVHQFRKAVQLDPESVDARLELARRTEIAGEALVQWKLLLSRDDFKHREEAFVALIELHQQAGRTDLARTLVAQAREAGYQNLPSLAPIEGITSKSPAAKLPLASPKLDQAAKEEQHLYRQAQLALGQGEAESALRTFVGIKERGQFQGPPAGLFIEIARANLKLSRYNEALHNFKQALNYKPKCERILCQIALVHHKAGDKDSALATFEEAVESNPQSPWPLLMMGNFLIKTKQTDEAIKALKACLELDTKSEYHRVQITLGRLYALNEKMDEARACLLKAEEAGLSETELERLGSVLS